MTPDLAALRALLVADLDAVTDGVQAVAFIPEALAAPAWIVRPATPWVTTDSEPFRSVLVRWTVTAVVDVATNEKATADLDALVAAAVSALNVVEVSDPYVYASNTALHLAADLTIHDHATI